MISWTDEDRKRLIRARVAAAIPPQLSVMEKQANRLPDNLRDYTLQQIAAKRKENNWVQPPAPDPKK